MAIVAFGAVARAEAPRIDVRAPAVCGTPASELEPRVERALDGARAPERYATVSIEPTATGFRAVVTTRDRASGAGTTAIAAPTCDEVVDAAVEVLSFALREEPAGSSPPPLEPAGPPEDAPGSSPEAPFVDVRRSTRVDRGERRPAKSAVEAGPRTRVSVAAGPDFGTLPDPTLIVSGRFSRSLPVLEVQAVARYGLPTVHETVETDFTESVRRDFATLELRACRGAGATVRVSACAGGEVGVARATHELDTGGRSRDEKTTTPRVAGTFAAQFSHPGGRIEPELELAGAAVAAGRDSEAPWLAVRITAGAALAF
jgi:hypothetical protein